MLDTTATVTAKGQVTIPAEIRRALGIRPHDRVRLELSDGRLTLRREPDGIERFKGIVPASGLSMSAEELREAFEEGVAKDVVKRMRSR